MPASPRPVSQPATEAAPGPGRPFSWEFTIPLFLGSPVSRRNLVRGPVIAAALTCLAASAGVLLLDAKVWVGWIVVITLVFGVYVGSIASSAVTGIVFRTRVSDSGVHVIAWIMIGASLALAAISVADRTLRGRIR